ncbi:hypothetical protein TTHERM_00240460 (macronuclear) [Tetrahymena thermophila SB210]|uniref:Uncharacterized protein n=1 Tax=Tetrahymena thermophila (strain SB210) TaxID=312017 RepID=I7MMD2_TETTS|nr:hypothetical protein TTHERM_00240460 [Tetrahymena thermophila SB210]EAS04626.1 hypothetical protein TTHERM_00240460 [Tetrahymena thermophila SB210]|eukprot:XP_001024871.1 hypothetical protein TTHERM_00240460 [Tetrahymena thermophila SB210]
MKNHLQQMQTQIVSSQQKKKLIVTQNQAQKTAFDYIVLVNKPLKIKEPITPIKEEKPESVKDIRRQKLINKIKKLNEEQASKESKTQFTNTSEFLNYIDEHKTDLKLKKKSIATSQTAHKSNNQKDR